MQGSNIYLGLGILFLLYRAYRIYYNLYLHPLAKIPGPKLYAISWFPRLWRQHIRGSHYKDLVKLHEKYGIIVRVGPDEVSNATGSAWEAIGGRSQQFMRDLNFFSVSQLQVEGKSFIAQNKEDHHAIRRLLLPAFTNKAFMHHEDIVNVWLGKVRESIDKHRGEEFNAERLFTWFAFDVMGVLSFGEDFGCLQNERNHPYLHAAELGAPFLSVMQCMLRFPATRGFYNLGLRLPWMKLWNSLRTMSDATAAKWLDESREIDMDRGDIMTTIYKGMQDEKTPITRIQALDVASILVLSGSEATPILMTAMMWNILATPRVYKRVMQEIRDSGIIKSAADITAANTDKMPYMDAVIQESLRTDTPFATTIPRVVPAGGAMVDGYWLPGGSTCGVPHYTAGHWEYNFTDPQLFVPERWLPERDARYANDKRDAFRPFAKGSLDCIGKRYVPRFLFFPSNEQSQTNV
jgi:cytochrome P450